jgi:hypothetical protein
MERSIQRSLLLKLSFFLVFGVLTLHALLKNWVQWVVVVAVNIMHCVHRVDQ